MVGVIDGVVGMFKEIPGTGGVLTKMTGFFGFLHANVTMILAALVILGLSNAISAYKGYGFGVDHQKGIYEAEKSTQLNAVVLKLDELQRQDESTRKLWEASNRDLSLKTDELLARKLTSLKERVIEKPIYIGNDCRAHYSVIELLNAPIDNEDN